MKNRLQLLALASSLLCLSGIATANPVIYGKANVSLNKHDAEDIGGTTEDRWKINSNASRLGVMGEQALQDDLSAIYKMEYQVAIDDGEAQSTDVAADCDGNGSLELCDSAESTFKQRNIYVGLKGSFGEIIVGKNDTPLKKAQGKVDRFNDLPLGDIKNVLEGENRESNILMYTSPDYNGFEYRLAVIPGEGSAATDDNGVADGVSGSIEYGADKFRVTLAADSEVDGRDETRLVGEYDLGASKIGVLYQTGEDVASGAESSGYVVSGQHTIDSWVLKGQYAARTDDGTPDVDTYMTTLGADYKLSKQVKLYAYLSSWGTDTADTEQSTAGIGTEVKF